MLRLTDIKLPLNHDEQALELAILNKLNIGQSLSDPHFLISL